MKSKQKQDINSIPGYVTAPEAARIIGCSRSRVYQYVDAGRLEAKRLGPILLLQRDQVENFQRGPIGRQHGVAPKWRRYSNGSKFIALTIYAQLVPGMEETFLQKIEEERVRNLHTFVASFSRYILVEGANVTITIIWKNFDLPDDALRNADLLEFRQEFALLFDWDTAEYAYATVPLLT